MEISIAIATIAATLAAGASFIKRSKHAQEVRELYGQLRKATISATAGSLEVSKALDLLQDKPDSRDVKEFLERQLYSLDFDDSDLQSLSEMAETLLKAIEKKGYTASLTGSGAIAQGPGSTAVGQRGVAIGGDVHGSVIVTGDGNAITPPKPWPRKK